MQTSYTWRSLHSLSILLSTTYRFDMVCKTTIYGILDALNMPITTMLVSSFPPKIAHKKSCEQQCMKRSSKPRSKRRGPESDPPVLEAHTVIRLLQRLEDDASVKCSAQSPRRMMLSSLKSSNRDGHPTSQILAAFLA